MNDDLVRDALADLAPLAPADDAAYAGVRRAVSRRRRRRATGRIAAAVLVLGVIAGGALAATGLQEDEGGLSTRPPRERVSFGDISLELPASWQVIRSDTDSMCIGPAGNPYPRYDDCSGLELYRGDPLPGHEMGEYQDHGPWGWYQATDVSPCPDRPHEPGEPLDGIQPTDEHGYEPIASDDRTVGNRTGVAVYDRWAARCERSGFVFYPRAWHLVDDQILIVDVLGQEETDAILASVRWRN
jgi:hypothetical protein